MNDIFNLAIVVAIVIVVACVIVALFGLVLDLLFIVIVGSIAAVAHVFDETAKLFEKQSKPVADVSKPKPDTVSHVKHEPTVESIKRTCPCASGQLKNDRHIMVEGYVNCDGCMWPTYTKYYASLYYSLKTGDMNSKGQAWNGDRWVDQQNQGDVS